MTEYSVTWKIDIADADTPRHAAEQALIIQRDPESIATFFEVREYGTDRLIETVDLEEVECPEHPTVSGGDQPHEQCHAPEDHEGPGPCRCTTYSEVES